MVQWLADPSMQAQAQRTARDAAAPPKRPARRGYSVTDFQGDAVPDFLAALHVSAAGPAPPSSTTTTTTTATTQHIPTEASIPENAVLRTVPRPVVPSTPAQQALVSSLRPQLKKKPPRRSYSATDKEPEDAALAPDQPRPSARMALGLLDLPPELHYALLDFLDPIDAVCLGLAHPKLYAVHRRKNARVALSTRYNGPNDLEWVWRGVRHHLQRSPATATQQEQEQEQEHEERKNRREEAEGYVVSKGLEKLRVKGQVYCRKCGISRCELHRHLKSWMGDGYEYCEIRERFGAPAPEGARSYCFMSSPKDRNRCGRHCGTRSLAGTPSSTTTPLATPAVTP